MNSVHRYVALRYAHAFLNVFELNQENYASLSKAYYYLKNDKGARLMVSLPASFDQAKKDFINNLIAHYALPTSIRSLTDLLIQHKRLFLLTDIIACVELLALELHGIEVVDVRSSHRLAQEDLEFIEQFLTVCLRKKIMMQYSIDSSLIAGIRMQSDRHLWEYSIAKQVRDIEKVLQYEH
jgi:ATP synthase F1 delta subunit